MRPSKAVSRRLSSRFTGMDIRTINSCTLSCIWPLLVAVRMAGHCIGGPDLVREESCSRLNLDFSVWFCAFLVCVIVCVCVCGLKTGRPGTKKGKPQLLSHQSLDHSQPVVCHYYDFLTQTIETDIQRRPNTSASALSLPSLLPRNGAWVPARCGVALFSAPLFFPRSAPGRQREGRGGCEPSRRALYGVSLLNMSPREGGGR